MRFPSQPERLQPLVMAIGSGAWALRYGLAVLLIGVTVAAWAGDPPEAPPEVPVPGMVTVASFGAVNCIPCRLMVPIREELQREYDGRVAIVFINLHRHYELIDQYAIQVIPTLIFYDESGNEAKRHIGFMDKQSIEAEMVKLGVEQLSLEKQ